MTPRARLADPADAESVASLLIDFRDHLQESWPSDDAFRAGVRRLITDPETEYLLGFTDGDPEPLGVVQLRYRYGIWRAGIDCLVEDVFVREAARGSGLGRAMMAAAVERARARGARRMELDVNEGNSAALALYQAFGFSASNDRYDHQRDLYMLVHLDADG